jgi:hypothetical protein
MRRYSLAMSHLWLPSATPISVAQGKPVRNVLDQDLCDPDRVHSKTRLETVAVNLCAVVLIKGNRRFVIALDELMNGSGLDQNLFSAAMDFAVEHYWLRRGMNFVQLRAAGIFLAKEALDLPR